MIGGTFVVACAALLSALLLSRWCGVEPGGPSQAVYWWGVLIAFEIVAVCWGLAGVFSVNQGYGVLLGTSILAFLAIVSSAFFVWWRWKILTGLEAGLYWTGAVGSIILAMGHAQSDMTDAEISKFAPAIWLFGGLAVLLSGILVGFLMRQKSQAATAR